jgi:threonylcarbamoyladenosine tRNA methylthiotransferase MtaB
MIKFKIYTLGCKVNQYDSGRLERLLAQSGFMVGEKKVDLAIINTCAVTKTAIVKDRRMINLARKENPDAKIVVIGCWPKAYELSEDVDLIGAEKTPELTAKKIKGLYGLGKKGVYNHSVSLLSANSDRSRYFIKVQDGCNQFCSYCIIPYTRGRLHSRPQSQIIAEIKAAIASGYQEIVLSGIHLGLYGQEKAGGKTNLVALMKKVLAIRGLGRLRLSSIEITEVTDELIELMARNKKVCQHLHISLQSGSDKILSRMNRPYDSKYFLNRINKLRRALPLVAVSTDVIVGFPGETDKDFSTTYNFCREVGFSKIHVFSFSAHEKTPAAKMSGVVAAEKIKERSHKLRSLSAELEAKYQAEIKDCFLGKELALIVEGEKNGKFKGKTEFYFDIAFLSKQMVGANRKKPKLGELVRIILS